MPFNIGPGELILILVIALVVLGPGKLPDVASSLGKSVREFRKAATDVTEAGRLDATSTASTTASETTAAPTATAATTAAAAPATTAAPVDPAPVAAVQDEPAVTAGTAVAPARDSDDS